MLSDNINSDLRNSFLFEVIIYIFKLVNPSYLLNFTREDPYIVPVLWVCVGVITFMLLLGLYALFVASQDSKGFEWPIRLWRWTFKTQGRLLYYLIASFWVRGILAIAKGEFEVKGISNNVVVVFYVVFILIGYILSNVLETQFHDILSTKNFLDSKNSDMQVLTLTQKFVLQVIQLCCRSSDLKAYWLTSSFGLVFCTVRVYKFFQVLPLYDYKALRLQAFMNSVVFSLNLAYFMEVLLKTVRYTEIHMNTIIILWAILSLLVMRISDQRLNVEYMSLLTSKGRGHPEKVLHKIRATKELLAKYRVHTKKNKNYKLTNLLFVAVNKNIEKVFGLDLELMKEKSYCLKEEEDANEIYLEYLKGLYNMDPENGIIKLHLAKVYAKKYQMYTEVIKLTSDLQKSKYSPYCISASFLLSRVEEKILRNCRANNEERKLDIMKY
ncbi:MAG: hypothetical protein EOO43_15835, partial [Flavobacterium sp.]